MVLYNIGLFQNIWKIFIQSSSNFIHCQICVNFFNIFQISTRKNISFIDVYDHHSVKNNSIGNYDYVIRNGRET